MVGSTWVLLVALIIFGVTLVLHAMIANKVQWLRLPLTWFYASWIVGLFMLTLPIFRYSEQFGLASGAMIIGVLFSASLGSLSAAFWHVRQRSPFQLQKLELEARADSQQNISQRWIGSLLILGLVGTFLLVVNTILSGGLTVVERFDSDNLAAVRATHMMATQSQIGLLYGPATLASSIGGLGIAFLFYLRGARRFVAGRARWMYFLALVVLALNVLTGLFGFGSRMFAVFAVLTAFLAFVEGRWSVGENIIAKRLTLKRFLAIFFSGLAVLAVLWFAATYFLEKRVQRQSPTSLLHSTHRASFDPTLYALIREDTASQYFFFSLSYLTTPIPTLTYYVDLSDARQPGPFFGEYNFPAIARWVRRLIFLNNPIAWDEARYEIFKPLGDAGFGTNVWSTLIRDLMADFTKSGALVFVAFVAFLAQRVFDGQIQRPNARAAGLLVYLRLILAFSGLVSILFMPQIHWPLYFSIGLLLFWRGGLVKLSVIEQFARHHSMIRPGG